MLKITEDILDDLTIHYFAKDIIRKALDKDLLDAYTDILLAAKVIKKEMDAIMIKEVNHA